MAQAFPLIRAEWDRFVAVGGRLPLIEDVLTEHQGNRGPWRVGLLFARGRPLEPLSGFFPATMEALAHTDGIRSALWSVLGPRSEIPEHVGPNAGVLRYHLGVDCPSGARLLICPNGVDVTDGATELAYRDGEQFLFDDTVPHAAFNPADRPRVTLFCEFFRPLPALANRVNRVTQAMLSIDPRYRHAPARAAEWHRSLNPHLEPASLASSPP